MRSTLTLLVLLFGLACAPAHAQTAINCPTSDTTEFTTGGAVILSTCSLNNGQYGAVFVTVTGQVTCGPLSDIELNLVAGAGPAPTYTTPGASFHGQIASGVLTINDWVTSSSFGIASGQTLFDANSGSQIPGDLSGSTLTVTGQTDATHYTVSNESLTVANEQMWALNVTAPLGKPPSSIQISRDPLEHLACQNGDTYIVKMSGTIRANDLSINLNVWAAILMTSESVAGGNPQSATWSHGQISMNALSNPSPRFSSLQTRH